MKIINIVLFSLLIISLWGILSIGIGVIPLINIDMEETSCENWNKVLLNLSYSYLAGMIIYILTVFIPNYNRRNINKEIIKNHMSSFSTKVYQTFYMLYSKEDWFPEFEKRTGLKKEIQFLRPHFDYFQENIFLSDNEAQINRFKRLIMGAEEFFTNMAFYENYLNDEQLISLNEIRKSSFLSLLFPFEMNNLNEEYRMIYSQQFQSYIIKILNFNKKIT